MISANLTHIHTFMQHRQEGIVTKKGFSLTNLIHNLITEYGSYRDGTIYIDVDDLDLSDKRLILSHIEEPEWYEYACESELKTNALFDECKNYIQKLMNQECDEVYRDIQEEMRAYK